MLAHLLLTATLLADRHVTLIKARYDVNSLSVDAFLHTYKECMFVESIGIICTEDFLRGYYRKKRHHTTINMTGQITGIGRTVGGCLVVQTEKQWYTGRCLAVSMIDVDDAPFAGHPLSRTLFSNLN